MELRTTQPGSKLILDYLKNLANKNKVNVSIQFTNTGVKSTIDLINMINELYLFTLDKNNPNVKDHKLLFEFITARWNPDFKFYFELGETNIVLKDVSAQKISLSSWKKLDISNQNTNIKSEEFTDAYTSGVYCFTHLPTGKIGIGSSISCAARLRDHISSFNGHRTRTFLHDWVNKNGGIKSLSWTPIITYPNIYQEWYKRYPSSILSIGGINLLRAFALYPSRVFEQGLIDHYNPFLNNTSIIGFYNFNLEPKDFLRTNLTTYQVWDITLTKLILTSHSIKDLSRKLGIERSTIKTYLNWYLGLNVIIEDITMKVIIREQGKEIRTEKTDTQLSLKQRFPLIKLIGRNLNDLPAGLTFVIDPVTTKNVFQPFNSRFELFKTLFPNKWEKLITDTKKRLTSRFIVDTVATNIGQKMNLNIPGGIKTELGSFLFCCNPNEPFLVNRLPKPLYSVTSEGLCTWYPNNSAVPNMRRDLIRLSRNNLESINGVRYLDESLLLNLFPSLPKGVGFSYQLTSEELTKLTKFLLK